MPYLLVVRVSEDGEAARGGICVGDIIVSYDGIEVQTDEDFGNAIRASDASTSHGEIEVGVVRNSLSKFVTVSAGPLGLTTKTVETEDDLQNKEKFKRESRKRAPSVLLSTSGFVPGYSVTTYCGLVKGGTVQSRNVVMDALAAAKSVLGGEIETYTNLLTNARDTALRRMKLKK